MWPHLELLQCSAALLVELEELQQRETTDSPADLLLQQHSQQPMLHTLSEGGDHPYQSSQSPPPCYLALVSLASIRW